MNDFVSQSPKRNSSPTTVSNTTVSNTTVSKPGENQTYNATINDSDRLKKPITVEKHVKGECMSLETEIEIDSEYQLESNYPHCVIPPFFFEGALAREKYLIKSKGASHSSDRNSFTVVSQSSYAISE